MSNTYRITSKAGVEMGVYQGPDETEAFAAMVADGVDGTDADGGSTAGSPADWIIEEVEEWEAWVDGDSDGAVRFFAPVAGAFDIETAATALGVGVSDALNVQRV